MARYNFTNFLVRNFEIQISVAPYEDEEGRAYRHMTVSGFLSYDEALQYARQLYADKAMAERLKPCQSLIISSHNLALLGTRFSFDEYQKFYEDIFLPMKISDEQLLIQPEGMEIIDPEDEGSESEEATDEDGEVGSGNNDFDFGDDFW